MARALDALGVDIIEAGFPIASPADAEAVRQVAREVRRPGDRRARPLPRRATSRRPRARSARRRGGGIHTFLATSDLHLARKLRMTARGVPRARSSPASGSRARSPTMWSSRRRMRRAATATFSAASSRRPSARAPRRSTCRTRSATPRRTRSRDFFADVRARVPNADQAIVQRALPRRSRARGRRTASPRSRAARGRSSARSTASASAPATPRSRRSSWRCASGAIACRYDTAIEPQALYRDEPAADRAHRRGGAGEQGDRRPQRVRARGRHPPGRRAEGSAAPTRSCGRRTSGSRARTLVLGKHSGRHAVQRRCEALGLERRAGGARTGLPRRDSARRAPQGRRRRRSAPDRHEDPRQARASLPPRTRRTAERGRLRPRRCEPALRRIDP